MIAFGKFPFQKTKTKRDRQGYNLKQKTLKKNYRIYEAVRDE